MAAVATASPGAETPDWARKYPPLLALGVAVLIALLVLPSALHLPQSNPTETLEYAPVPPDQNSPPLQNGNESALGLGSSSGVNGGGAGGGGGGGGPAALPPPPKKGGKNPTRYRCVGNPPRQTEDPLSPPCVAFFDGDNFGSTYNGVTGDEVRLLVYIDGGINYTSGSGTNNVAPTNKYYDLFQPPDPNAEPEHLLITGMRAWQRYFNDRFQTYNRRVHFYVYLSGGANPRTPEERRSDAADNYSTVKPFAVVSEATEGAEDDYLNAMAKKGVLNFGSFSLRESSFFATFPKLIWGYLPSIQVQVEQYVNYVCTKVANKPSVMAGNPTLNNVQRKYGMIRTRDQNWPNLIDAANQIKSELKSKCGITISKEATFPVCCLAQDNSEFDNLQTTGQTTPTQQAATDMADFQSNGITTILWPGGLNGNYGKGSSSIGYQPEWVLMGDGLLDAPNPERLAQNTNTFNKHAVVATPATFEPGLHQQLCYQAYREADSSTPESDVRYTCEYYHDFLQFFTGVQVAGPRLGPTSIDQGMHAIPAVPSTNVQVPACFYNPGDYTCVKDGEEMYWDAGGTPPGSNEPGCWRAIEGGKRYLGKWPDGNINAQITGDPAREPCNGFDASARFNLA